MYKKQQCKSVKIIKTFHSNYNDHQPHLPIYTEVKGMCYVLLSCKIKFKDYKYTRSFHPNAYTTACPRPLYKP